MINFYMFKNLIQSDIPLSIGLYAKIKIWPEDINKQIIWLIKENVSLEMSTKQTSLKQGTSLNTREK